MKKYSTLYFFLFVLLVLGAFASMAQYSYGLKLCGIACLGLTGVFLHEAFSVLQRSALPARRWMDLLEVILFACIAFTFMLRNFSFDFALSGILMSSLLTILLFATLSRAVVNIRLALPHGWQTVLSVTLYYAATIVFILFLLFDSIFPAFENVLAVTGIVLFGLFLALAFILKRSGANADGNEGLGTWQYVRQLPDKSVLVVTIGFLFAVLSLLISNRIYPPFYRGTTPDGYQHLVDQGAAESGTLKAQEFKDQYEKFIQRHGK